MTANQMLHKSYMRVANMYLAKAIRLDNALRWNCIPITDNRAYARVRTYNVLANYYHDKAFEVR